MITNTHYFWAVKVPDVTKQGIQDKVTTVKEPFPFKRWVHMQDYHITLAFLGSASQQQLQGCIPSVEDAIKNEKAFSLEIQGINIFGNEKMPRIFWAAVNAEQKLYQLQKLVYDKCIEAGFILEERPYHPHLTLARNWMGSQPFSSELLENYNPFTETLTFPVKQVVLYKTNLDQTPKYEPIVTISLSS